MMDDPDKKRTACMHGAPFGSGCIKCKRLGFEDAQRKFANDPGYRKAVTDIATNAFIKTREKLCRAAVMAMIRDKGDLACALHNGEGVWVAEMSPLNPAEREIVIAQIRRMWNIPKGGSH